MIDLAARLRTLLASGEPAILVRVASALGSTPREAGAAMVVTAATSTGTVGGGALERLSIERARTMIAAGEAEAMLAVPLGPRIGQCCGGHVTLALAAVDAALLASEEARDRAQAAARPAVLIFGAGHTGQSLARALALLPLQVGVVDTRPDALATLPEGVDARALALPETAVAAARPGTAFLVMTHDHQLDFLIAAAALGRGDATYVGMIGSATKREKFRRHLRDAGAEALIDRLVLPIGGLAVRDKRPEVIAALTAAELVSVLLGKAEEKAAGPVADAASQCNSEPIASVQPKGRHARAS
ncbi:xanthine dehydrogenase accessory protein XdhC [Aureimonas sp. SA4125]|uniref:xanthine dehydrogenase accessory protein XdhC n=1 Tax=Aureimonas sp. SA4125 TaxID=2826993 RepID=UPI001CC4BB2C|nr:xanthine dehydrogenase accessory protein XdhC [Aureimonas sp. SA4125]BDA86272.1 xanthine dehydrogenase accessory protein XdhC [Aureimonas sp. SA4125]